VLLVRLVDAHARGDLIVEREAPEEVKYSGNEQIGTGSFSQKLDIEEDQQAMRTAPAGKHAVEVVANLEVLEGHELDFDGAKPLFSERKELKAEFDLVEREAAAIEIIPDDSPELRKRVEAAIKVDSAVVLPRSGYMIVRTSAKSPPVPMAFRVTVRQGGHQWIGSRTYGAGVNNTGAFIVPAKGFDGDRVDVIFEPDVNVALGTIDATRMWNGRLEFRDVPIERPPPTPTEP
jgi:hypothetical protein